MVYLHFCTVDLVLYYNIAMLRIRSCGQPRPFPLSSICFTYVYFVRITLVYVAFMPQYPPWSILLYKRGYIPMGP